MSRAETPHRLDSWTNLRGHWRSLEKRKNAEKTVTVWLLRSMGALPLLPIVVRLTRLGPRDLDDDNLPGAFKYVRDTIAKEYGTHDGTKAPIRWEHSQRQTTTKDATRYGFVVEIESTA